MTLKLRIKSIKYKLVILKFQYINFVSSLISMLRLPVVTLKNSKQFYSIPASCFSFE